MTTTLSFEALDAKIEEWIAITEKKDRPGAVERWSFWGALVAGGLTLLLMPLLTGQAALWVAIVGLLLEFSGFAVFVFSLARRTWKEFRQQRRVFARELDGDFALYRAFVEWLRRMPRDELEQRLHFIQNRRTNMRFRLGLVTGGLERLGILPVMFALFLQFKDWEWADWGALADVNPLAGYLLLALGVVYGGGWMIIRLMVRLDAYETLIAEAVRVPREEDGR